MPKPYTLRLYTPLALGTPTFRFDLTRYAQNWKRSIRAVGGYWQGSFRLTGAVSDLAQAFDQWLGYHVQERSGGGTTWEGLVYEMDLTVGGVKRRRSFDLMANSVKSTYVDWAWIGDNCIKNPSFEDAGGAPGGGDEIAAWGERTGVGVISHVNSTAHTGSYCVGITGDGTFDADDAPTCNIHQNISVTPGEMYRLTFWCYGVDGNQISFGVRDPNAGQWLTGQMLPSGNLSATWVGPGPTNQTYPARTFFFTGPSEGEVMIFFGSMPHDDKTALVDDVAVVERGESVFQTPWTADILDWSYQCGLSIARYGRKEEILHYDNCPLDTSEAGRDTFQREHLWPWPRPVGATAPGEAVLDVQCAGYVFTMNWMYQLVGDGDEHRLDEWLSSIVGLNYGLSLLHGGTVATAGDCQFIKTGSIAQNGLLVKEVTGAEQRPWDVISELVSLGIDDGSGDYVPARAWVGTNQLLHYAKVDTTPHYFIRADGIFDSLGGHVASSNWTMRPAVFRDMVYPRRYAEPGSFLADTRDIWVEEVEMADGWSRPMLKTTLFTESELLRAQVDLLGGGELEEPHPPAVPHPPFIIT